MEFVNGTVRDVLAAALPLPTDKASVGHRWAAYHTQMLEDDIHEWGDMIERYEQIMLNDPGMTDDCRKAIFWCIGMENGTLER